MNRWKITNEATALITGMTIGFIDRLKGVDIEQVSPYSITLELSDIPGIGPYHIQKILEGLGYELKSNDTNGWQGDYWYYFEHKETKEFPPLCLSGTAVIHEMTLRGQEDCEIEPQTEQMSIEELQERSYALLDKVEKFLIEEKMLDNTLGLVRH